MSAAVCVHNADEYSANKDQLPKLLQDLQGKPLILTGHMLGIAAAAVKISVDGSKLHEDVSADSPKDHIKDDAYIAEICYDPKFKKLTITNVDGKSADATVNESKNTIAVQGLTLKSASAADYAAMVEKIGNGNSPPQNAGAHDGVH